MQLSEFTMTRREGHTCWTGGRTFNKDLLYALRPAIFEKHVVLALGGDGMRMRWRLYSPSLLLNLNPLGRQGPDALVCEYLTLGSCSGDLILEGLQCRPIKTEIDHGKTRKGSENKGYNAVEAWA